jgi:hypothetical protein
MFSKGGSKCGAIQVVQRIVGKIGELLYKFLLEVFVCQMVMGVIETNMTSFSGNQTIWERF